jgi:hypothetical protein
MTWVYRHRWALIALVVLIPAAVLAGMSVLWFRYTAANEQHPIVVAKGDTGSFVTDSPTPEKLPAARLTLTSYTVVPADSGPGQDVGLLKNTEAVSAIIHVDASGMPEDTFSCNAVLVAPGPDGDRTWEVAGPSDIDYYPTGDLHAFCDLSSGGQFDWEAVFVVPVGVGDSALLRITDGGFIPKAQLQLEH